VPTIHSYNSHAAFLERVETYLATHEVENNLILGLCSEAARKPPEEPWLLWTVEAGGDIVGAAIRTPGQNLILTRLDTAAEATLIAELIQQQIALPGVSGPVDATAAFVRRWTEATGQAARVFMNQCIYECRTVVAPVSVPGRMRPAADGDANWLVNWVSQFHDAIGLPESLDHVIELVAARTASQKLWIWEDGEPVSCAGYSRDFARWAAIVFVYTPPEFRGRGYASACVAALTQQLLATGREFCCLYTDAANPTSNRIYQQIGYRPVCQATMWRFDVRNDANPVPSPGASLGEG
jgi:predicted GNAT family acetyltransferase